VSAPRIPVAFRPRTVPLAPIGCAARGPAARALAARLARTAARDEAALTRLSGVSGPSLLVILGRGDELPWVDGVVYLGRDPAAPALLLPTTLEPDVPAALLERSLLAHESGLAPPLVVLADPPLVASAGIARPIARAAIQGLLTRDESAT
jgi:hypothetical protein